MKTSMKKWFLLAILCLGMLFAVLAGCSPGNEQDPPDTDITDPGDDEDPDKDDEDPDQGDEDDPEPGKDETAPVFTFEGYTGSEITLPDIAAGQAVVFPAVRVTDDTDGDITENLRIYAPTGAQAAYEDAENGRTYTLTLYEAGTFETILRSDDVAGNRGVATVTFTITAATPDSEVSEEEASIANLAESEKVYKESFASGSANALVGLNFDAEYMSYRSDSQAIDGTSLVVRYDDDAPYTALLSLRDYLTRPGTLSIEFDIKLLSGTGSNAWYFGLTPLNSNIAVDLSGLKEGEKTHVTGNIVVDNDTAQALSMFVMSPATMEIALDNFVLSYRDQTVPTYIPTQAELESETGAVWDWTTKAMAVGNGEIVAVPSDLAGKEGFSENVMYINNAANSGSDFYATNDLFVVGETYEISFSYQLLSGSALSGVHATTGFNEMKPCGGTAGEIGVYKAHFTAKDGDVRYILYGIFEAYIGDFSVRVMDESELEEPVEGPFEAPANMEWVEAPGFLQGQEGFSDIVLYGEILNTGADFYNFTVEAGKTYHLSFKYYLVESGWGNWNQIHFSSDTVNELQQTVDTVLTYELEYTAVEGDSHFFLFSASKIYIGDITFEEIETPVTPPEEEDPVEGPFAAPAGGQWVEAPEFLQGQDGFSDVVLYGEYTNAGFDFNNFTVEAGKTYRLSFKYYLIESGWGNWNQVHFGNGTKVNELQQTVGTVLSYELEYTAAEGDSHFSLFGASKIYIGDITFEEVDASGENPPEEPFEEPFEAPANMEWVEAPEFLQGQEGFSEYVLYGEIVNTGADFYNFTVEAGKTYHLSFKYYLVDEPSWGNWNQIHFGSGKVEELQQTTGTVLTYELEYTAVEGDSHFFLFSASKIYIGDITFEEVAA